MGGQIATEVRNRLFDCNALHCTFLLLPVSDPFPILFLCPAAQTPRAASDDQRTSSRSKRKFAVETAAWAGKNPANVAFMLCFLFASAGI